MRIENACVYTMEGQPIPNGYVQVEEGKIAALGPMEELCGKDSCVIDARGAMLFPGFIDAHTHLGMWEDSLNFEGDDGNEETDPCTPQLRAVDAINPCDRCFEEALEAGVTTVVTGPGSANPIGGQMAAMKTFGHCVDDMVVKAPCAIKMALGENPKRVYSDKNQTPATRMATAAIIREQLYKAKRYYEDVQCAMADGEAAEPDYDIKCEAILPVLRGEIPVHIHAHRLDDIFTAVRLAGEFGFSYILVHATQGYEAAEELAGKQVKIFSGPLLCDRSKPELGGLTPKSAGILAKAGVELAIVTDHPVVPVQYLPLCAGLAVREGMEHASALRAITINPAKLCGIDDRVGSLAVGKDADLVLFDTDPLELRSKPRLVVAGGKIIKSL